MTWDEISTKVLADCGRCCCLCRRFKPIRLQVHHIVPRGEGGKDELDNAIALCLTCHTDVHTKAPFTRRFTVEELKMHRENVYRLVAEGKPIRARGRDRQHGNGGEPSVDEKQFEDELAKVEAALEPPTTKEGHGEWFFAFHPARYDARRWTDRRLP